MTAPHSVALVITNSTPIWYTTRATGLVALVLLTAGMSAGLLSSVRFERPRWPRFVTLGLHRNLTLLALAFTLVHVVTNVLDSFVSIPLQDAFIPFIGTYRPLWLSFGAIAFDLMLALVITSLARTRMNLTTWRVVHWSAYACWPIAVVHGLGTGTDTPQGWVLALTAACVAVVVILTLRRLALSWPYRPGWTAVGVTGVLLSVIAGTVWLKSGPLAPHWSTRAGTPTSQAGSAPGTGGSGGTAQDHDSAAAGNDTAGSSTDR